MGKLNNETPVYARNMGLKYFAEFNADNQVIYEGWALDPRAAAGDLSWQIIKHTYTSGNLTASAWANSSDDFVFSWTARATYSY